MDASVHDVYETILLHSASYQGESEVVETLLNRAIKLNVKNHWGETVLHLVSRGRQNSKNGVRVAELLLERGVEVQTRNTDDDTPLHLASLSGKLGIVRLLLDHGADASTETVDGSKLLHLVSFGQYECEADGVRVAELLLELGAEVDTRTKDHLTPLHLASRYGKLDMVRLLLDHGADPEANGEGEKTLHKVSYGEYRSQEDGVRVAQLLLERGADVNTRCNNHQTPLHIASYVGNVEIVRVLLDHGADPEAVAEGDMGEKPLHMVSYGKYRSQHDGVRVAQLLLEHGADVNTRRDDHWTPLHIASHFGDIEIVRLLLDHGADPEANAEGDKGSKPLHQVSYGKYRSQEDGVRVAQLLLEHGADINTRRNDHWTPLHIASHFWNIDIVRLLLNHGADPEANAEGDMGEKPLHQVSSGNNRFQEDGVRVAQLLLERGADVNTRRNDHQTPLHAASCFGNVEIVRLLLDHGADPEANAEGDMGEKPLHKVSYGEYGSQDDGVRVAQLLLERGAHVDTRRNDHWTPLHVASYSGNVEIVRLLLDHGADPEANAEGYMGSKPLHQVSCGKYRSQEDGVRVAQLLLERGADVDTRRNDHWTPLHVASYYGNVEIVHVLLDHGADPEADAEGDKGKKPLHMVSSGKYRSQDDGLRIARLLLERGADVNTRRNDDCTPLHVASYFGIVEIVRLLLDHGADPEANAEGDMGEKPLHQVTYGKYRSQEDGVRVAQLLLERGAAVNTRRNDRSTPLHIATLLGTFEIAQVLIDHRAEVDARDDFGETPLHNVSQGKYESQEDGVRTAQLLLDHGADANAYSNTCKTPLAFVSCSERPKLAELLLKHARDDSYFRPRSLITW